MDNQEDLQANLETYQAQLKQVMFNLLTLEEEIQCSGRARLY